MAGGVAAVIGQFTGTPVAADQQPSVPGRGRIDGDPRPVVPALALGAGPGGHSLPGPERQLAGQRVRPQSAACGGDRVAPGDGQHIARPGVSPGRRVTLGRRRRPRRRPPSPPESRHPAPGLIIASASAGLVANAVSPGMPAAAHRAGSLSHDSGRYSSRSISACPPRRGISEVDRDLGVLDPARGARVLPLHPCCGGALLHVAGLVHHQHPVRAAQMLGHIAAQVIADAISVPRGPRQQVLHPAGRGIPGVLRDAPAVGPRQPGQQAQHEHPGPPPRLHPPETSPDPEHQVIEDAQPAARVYAMPSGHRKIIMCPHKP